MAKDYKIQKISDGVRIWNENGHGMYSTLGQSVNKHIMDFFCVSNSSIKEVVRKSDGVVFKCGDRLGDGNTSIINFRFANKVIIINHGLGSQTILDVAVKYVQPAPQPAAIAPVITDGIFKAIQESISKERPVRIRINKNRSESLADFLVRFFKEWNPAKETIYVDDEATQTLANKRRSFGDILNIVRYYYPTATAKQVMNALVNEVPKKITTGYRTSFCSQIKKKVWYYDRTRENIVANSESKDEYGYSYKQYLSAVK
tara:strand:- start:1190 stop:1966 length:777 start_codon:yes stop_codon:yes gene_type:complete